MRDLSFTYPRGREPIFTDLSVGFRFGATTAITGPSGGGKSTLLYLLGLLLRPSGGQVLEDGVELSGQPDGERSAWRASRVGFVFQDAMLDPAQTIVENVCEGAFYSASKGENWEARAKVMLEKAGVLARFDHRPGEISGGQAQRVALCRALLKRPAIVLADEPTGNLDSDSASVVWQMLVDAANDGACVIIATHDKARAASCDEQVIV
ncbi:MAG: ATP-binding cassette domain-containing protein [Promicromonosporaceae bacterium]|nr:ATP-binding cassette domain-containing protein [Promicromonosporaceae bacterium]